jgi:CRP-like cAMP-binding protein
MGLRKYSGKLAIELMASGQITLGKRDQEKISAARFRSDEFAWLGRRPRASRSVLSMPVEETRVTAQADSMTASMRPAERPVLDFEALFAPATLARMIRNYKKDQIIFSQGEPTDAVFYVRKGGVKLSIVSKQGKEAVVEILKAGDLFGLGCLAGQPQRIATATTITPCSLLHIEKKGIARLLRKHQTFSQQLISYIILRKIRILDNLVDRAFNSTEERLARALLLLADCGRAGEPETVIPKVSQATLAEMIGTTRSRVSVLMNKFRRSGFIDYNGALRVRRSLLGAVLHD